MAMKKYSEQAWSHYRESNKRGSTSKNSLSQRQTTASSQTHYRGTQSHNHTISFLSTSIQIWSASIFMSPPWGQTADETIHYSIKLSFCSSAWRDRLQSQWKSRTTVSHHHHRHHYTDPSSVLHVSRFKDTHIRPSHCWSSVMSLRLIASTEINCFLKSWFYQENRDLLPTDAFEEIWKLFIDFAADLCSSFLC